MTNEQFTNSFSSTSEFSAQENAPTNHKAIKPFRFIESITNVENVQKNKVTIIKNYEWRESL